MTELNYVEGDSECVQSRLTRVEAEGPVKLGGKTRPRKKDDNAFEVVVAASIWRCE